MARRRRVEPTDEWAELELLLEWPEQVEYERKSARRRSSVVPWRKDRARPAHRRRRSAAGSRVSRLKACATCSSRAKLGPRERAPCPPRFGGSSSTSSPSIPRCGTTR